MSEPEKKDYNYLFLAPPGSVIDKKIYKFLLILLENIFLKPINPESYKKIEEYLKNWIETINTKIIKDKNKWISTEYTTENFENIIDFLKSQNKILAGDILEGILILIFSYAFKTDKGNGFGEFLYKNNLKDENSDTLNYDYKLENSENKDLIKWFKKTFLPNELENLQKLLKRDNSANKEKDARIEFLNDSPFYNLLNEIQKLKCINIKNKSLNTKRDKYIFRRNFKINKIIDNNFSKDFAPKKLIRSFFISVYIYYQNKHSPLMKYLKEEDLKSNDQPPKKDEKDKNEENVEEEEEIIHLAGVPFDYNLNDASLDSKFANTVLSPSRIEPRISKISMAKNQFEERGLYELSKILIFNKFVKKFSIDTSKIQSYYLDYLNLGLGIYDNNTLEELNLSYNNIKKDSEEYLTRIISHLKNLKTINLSFNDLRNGASSFFIMLKSLYRLNKTKLENLVINSSNLDNSSFYELGELLKSKYCCLKRLYLSSNYIPKHIHFLKKLKKNKNLTQIFFNKDNFNEGDTNDIMRIISNTHIESLYLFRNRITDFSDCLRILYRTKLMVEEDKEHNNKVQSSFLIDINLSGNNYVNKNEESVKLLATLIKNTTLYSLDLSHILFGNSPEKYEEKEDNKDYRVAVEDLKKYLNDDKEKYEENNDELNCIRVDIDDNKYYIEQYKKEILEDKDFNEEKIKKLIARINDKNYIEDRRAKYPLFLREKAKEIISEIIRGDQEEEFKSFIKDKLSIPKKENDSSLQNDDNKKGEDTVNFELYKKLNYFLAYNMALRAKINELSKKEDEIQKQKIILI